MLLGLGTVTQATSNTVQVTGVATTSALGGETVVAQAIQALTGNAGTSALGSETSYCGSFNYRNRVRSNFYIR